MTTAIASADIPHLVRRKFVVGLRWLEGPNVMPQLVCMCKDCGSFWIYDNTYSIHKTFIEHLTTFPCSGTIVNSEFGSEVSKILKALETAE